MPRENRPLHLYLFRPRYAIARLATDQPPPAWAHDPTFCAIMRTPQELCIICGETFVPDGVRQERGWRLLRIAGVVEFDQVGIIASLAGPLADANISLVPVATFDTDYLLVREHDLPTALETLRAAGHTVDALP